MVSVGVNGPHTGAERGGSPWGLTSAGPHANRVCISAPLPIWLGVKNKKQPQFLD